LHQFVRSARRFFTWLEEEGHIMVSPGRRLELPPLPRQYRRGITVIDRDRILAAAPSTRDHAIMLFLADTACRRAGLAGLRVHDLDLDRCRAIVREKGNKERIVFFLPSTAAAIRGYLSERPTTDHDYLFCGVRGRAMSAGAIYEVFRRAARVAGVRHGWNPHNWRHAAIRGMLARGMSLPAVSQIAGHASVQTTGDMYGVFSEEELFAMHLRCSWLA
jgi:site-specific recombinase XerD